MKVEKEDMFLGASPIIFFRARMLRIQMTEAEKLLWEELKDKKLNGCKFRRQHPILKFVLDFYCHGKKLAIELDGGIHKNTYQSFYDKDRTENLNDFGIKVIRFQNEEIINDIEGVKKKIIKELEN